MRRTARSTKSLSIVLLLALFPVTTVTAQEERAQDIDPQDERVRQIEPPAERTPLRQIEPSAEGTPQIDRQVPDTRTPPPTEAISGWWDEPITISNVDFPGKVIARLPVPEGSYVIVAKMEVSTHEDAYGVIGCRLIAGADSDQAQESWMGVGPNYGKKRYSPEGSLLPPQTIALNVVHTYTNSNSVLLQCWGHAYTEYTPGHTYFGVRNIKITAIRVAKLTNNLLELVE